MRKRSPGSVAQNAFRTGMTGVAIAGLAALAVLYWAGLSPLILGFLLIVIFPVFLAFAAAFINAWLGYGGTSMPLQRIEVPAEGAATDPEFPTRGGEASGSDARVERLLKQAAGSPGTHLVLIGLASAVGVVAAIGGIPEVAFFALALAYLVAVIGIQTFVWQRLEQYFEERRERAGKTGQSGLGRLPTEFTVGALVTLIVLFVLFVAVAVLRYLL